MPRLEAVVTHPILLADGTILTEAGYHQPSGLLVQSQAGLNLTVPDRPTGDDLSAASSILFDVVADFPFERPEHRAAWLAGLLSPLAWWAFDGPAPLFLIDGNVRGVGKGLLADIIALIVLGQRFPVMSYTPDREELRKRITSLAMEGERMVLLDNLAGAVGNDVLDTALTTDRWKDRLLGGNRSYDGPLHAVWYGTGNNCELRADTSRRTCHVRLETPEERPELRANFKYPNLRRYVRLNRGPLLSSALTLLRGWVAAGRPRAGLPAWGSFEGWSETVRECIAWLGLPDPGETRLALQTRADRDALAAADLLRGLRRIDPDGRERTAGEIVDAARTDPEFRAAVEDLAGRLDPRALGYKLRSFTRRNFEGLFLDHAGEGSSGMRWAACPASEFRSRRRASPESPGSADAISGDPGDPGDPPAGPARLLPDPG